MKPTNEKRMKLMKGTPYWIISKREYIFKKAYFEKEKKCKKKEWRERMNNWKKEERMNESLK